MLTPDDTFKRIPVFDVDQKPSKRDFHAACLTTQNTMLVIGGSNERGEKLEDIYSFSLPKPQLYSNSILAMSEA
jgi:hypothetical protein